jgi:hypothetical protein
MGSPASHLATESPAARCAAASRKNRVLPEPRVPATAVLSPIRTIPSTIHPPSSDACANAECQLTKFRPVDEVASGVEQRSCHAASFVDRAHRMSPGVLEFLT